MKRWLVLVLLAACGAGSASAQSLSYQRERTGQRGRAGDPVVARHYYHYPGHGAGRPSVAQGGSFQRPYPYHLDYYKQRYGGSYAPYFGNLYGPPNVVLQQPYGVYPAPGWAPPYAYGQSPPAVQPPQAVACPNCGHTIHFAAPAAAEP